MDTAIRTIDNQQVEAIYESKEDGFKYKCTDCESTAFLKKSPEYIRFKSPHFAHQKAAPDDCRFKHEKTQQQIIRRDIYKYLQNDLKNKVKGIYIEKKLVNTINFMNSLADIYIEGYKEKVVIKIQISEISTEEIIDVTSKYFDEDICLLWVFPYRLSRKRRIFPLDKLPAWQQFIYRMNEGQLFFWDTAQKPKSFNVVMKSGENSMMSRRILTGVTLQNCFPKTWSTRSYSEKIEGKPCVPATKTLYLDYKRHLIDILQERFKLSSEYVTDMLEKIPVEKIRETLYSIHVTPNIYDIPNIAQHTRMVFSQKFPNLINSFIYD